MSGIDKILDKMKNQPNGIRWTEAEQVLVFYGYEPDRQKGSHKHYVNEAGDVITVKIENPLKAVYIKDILRRIGK